MQQTVRLLGDLGERYGSKHTYQNLWSPADAIKLLCLNYPELEKELKTAHLHGIEYTLVQGDYFLDINDLHLPLGKNDLILSPVVAGSGGGVGKAIAGVALIAAAIVLAPVTGGTSFAFVPTALGTLGGSMLFGGIAEMISPQPTVPTFGGVNTDRTKPGTSVGGSGPQGVSRATSGTQSYAYSGPANTVGVGATVPLVYGEMLIGSHLLSSAVAVSDESDPASDYFTKPGSGSITVNGERVLGKFKSNAGIRTRTWTGKQVKMSNKGSGDEAIRRVGSNLVDDGGTMILNLQSTQKIKEQSGPFDDEGGSERKNFQVFFLFDRGFFNKVNGQIAPAFLTYQIQVSKRNLENSDAKPVVATAQATIQGLLRKTDRFRWCHSIVYGETGLEDGDTTIKCEISIVDTDAEASCRLHVRGMGYNFFHKKGQNNCAGLDIDS